MANIYTPSIGLAMPAFGDGSWHVPMNANSAWLDAILGPLSVQPTEYPSASTNIDIAAGTYRKINGTAVAFAATNVYPLPSNSTVYVYILESSGALSYSLTGWPASGTSHVRLAIVTTTSVVSSITPWTIVPGSVQ